MSWPKNFKEYAAETPCTQFWRIISIPKIFSQMDSKNAHRETQSEARPMYPRISRQFWQKREEFLNSIITGIKLGPIITHKNNHKLRSVLRNSKNFEELPKTNEEGCSPKKSSFITTMCVHIWPTRLIAEFGWLWWTTLHTVLTSTQWLPQVSCPKKTSGRDEICGQRRDLPARSSGILVRREDTKVRHSDEKFHRKNSDYIEK